MKIWTALAEIYTMHSFTISNLNFLSKFCEIVAIFSMLLFFSFLMKKLRLENGAKECIVQISARAFQRVLVVGTCVGFAPIKKLNKESLYPLPLKSLHKEQTSYLFNQALQWIEFLLFFIGFLYVDYFGVNRLGFLYGVL